MRRAPHEPKCSVCNKKCNVEVPLLFTWQCRKCDEVPRNFMCDTCRSYKICDNCLLKSGQLRFPRQEKLNGVPRKNNVKLSNFRCIFVLAAISVLFIVVYSYKYGLIQDKSIDENNFINKLKELYPSQRPETWYHFQSVLENKDLSVKSIIFLHNDDKTTSDCLIKELVSRFSGSKKIHIDEITFSEVGFEEVDYGLVLEHYHEVLKKFRVFRADLDKISGKHARIFHSLCDEVSSDVKPSLFIFTIKCSKQTENLKPLERATSVLKESWSDLSSNELHPLLSRVVKNVVDIVPEVQSSCIKEPV